MLKQIAAVGVLALAGNAFASFEIQGYQVVGSSNSGSFETNAALTASFGGLPGGLNWVPGLAGSPFDNEANTIIGLNPDAIPAADTDPLVTNAYSGSLPAIISDNFPTGSTGDESFDFAQTFTSEDSAGNITSDFWWIGMYAHSTGDFNLTANLDIVTDAGVNNTAFVLNGAPTVVDGVPYELVLLDRESGGSNAVVRVVPAPGAAALLGLAGVAGVRRRRA